MMIIPADCHFLIAIADSRNQDELLRRTVFGYNVTWAKGQLP